jgi:phosphatidylserine decarboxylase
MSDTSLPDLLKSWPLALLPHQLLSHLVRRATRSRVRWWKNLLIKRFISAFGVDMSEALKPDPNAYPDFNSFFTRALRDGSRPMPDDSHAIACPVDGTISQFGAIHADRMLQAKGHDYSLQALLGGERECAAQFHNGHFITLYLSPRDYHRIHMPLAGRLVQTTYIPGRLYSVAPHTTRAIPGLFTRNERLVCLFDTVHGPLAVILVGAIFVSCMETVWSGVVNPRMRMTTQTRRYERPADSPADLAQGAELGRFNMGSTVILLFGPDRIAWQNDLCAGTPVRTGEILGQPLPDN